MADTSEALEFIDSTRTKACTLYASDKLALPIVKAVDLLERMVKGDADEKMLAGDVSRLLDEVDYTRQRDEKRDDPLRSVVADVCKLIGLAARVIGVRKEEEEAPMMTEVPSGSNKRDAMKGTIENEAAVAQPGPSNPHSTVTINVGPAVPIAVRPQQQPKRVPLPPPTPTPAQSAGSSHWSAAAPAIYPSQPVKEESEWEGPGAMEELPKEEGMDLTGNEASTSSWAPHEGDDNSSHSSLPILSYLKRTRDQEQQAQQPSKRMHKERRTSARTMTLDDDEREEDEERDKDSDYDDEPDYAPTGLDRAKNEEPGEDGMYHCRLCTKKFAKLHGLRTHAYTHELTIPCTICHQVVKKDNMARHMCLVHNDGNDETEKAPSMPLLSHPCPICGQMCADEPHLNRHMRTHSGDNPFPCPHCDSSLRSASLRNRHIRMIHLVQPWQCATCGVQYAREKELKDHIVVNRGHMSLLQD